jgi:hypothetical protein
LLADEEEMLNQATFVLESLTLYRLLLLKKDDLVRPLLMFLTGDWDQGAEAGCGDANGVVGPVEEGC